MKLNAIQQKWVDALRSGAFEQGKGTLRREPENTFCCLGVLCELAARAGVVPPYNSTGYAGNSSSLPPEVMKWAGVKTRWGNAGSTELARENDQGATFDQIADIIVTKADSLFVPDVPAVSE